MTDLPGRIGKYTVARRLGAGGMGEVFLAYSPAGSPVAVKLIRSDRLDPHARARFEREALIARTVVGTNRVARFLDADPFADRPWLAMEYVPGRTLLEHVTEHGVLPLTSVASLGALVAEGLAAVHDVGLLHRDLKPQNIMLGADGPMIIDFGLGAIVDAPQDSLSHSGDVIGTVRCMPPEQASGRTTVTTAADVYAFGTVLLYAATGRYPYDGDRWQSIAAQVVSPAVGPDLTSAPAALVPLLTGMLAHDPAARPSLEEVAIDCAALLAAEGTSPMEARRTLISRTFGSQRHPFTDEPVVPLPRDGDAAGAEEDANALDTPRTGPPNDERGDVEPSGSTPSVDATTGEDGQQPAVPTAGGPDRRPGGGSGLRAEAGRRHPRQVAERLRAQYAVSRQLVDSRR